ncbi:hypothetical protein AAG570_005506, partial [Ranatra chinensis]
VVGRTALHWAAKRGHKDIVRLLVERGADTGATSERGETPQGVALSAEVRGLLGGAVSPEANADRSQLPITPNYLKNPPLGGQKVDYQNGIGPGSAGGGHRRHLHDSEYLAHQNDVAGSGDPDFIEIELARSELTYYALLRVCCDELGLNPSQVARLRKLPDTMLRKDKDVQRLGHMQELEVVVTQPVAAKHTPNGYKSIQLYKNQTILY